MNNKKIVKSFLCILLVSIVGFLYITYLYKVDPDVIKGDSIEYSSPELDPQFWYLFGYVVFVTIVLSYALIDCLVKDPKK